MADDPKTTSGRTAGPTTTGTATGRTGRSGAPDLGEMSQEMLDSAHRVWLAGLGALARAGDEGGRLFRQLVDRGREVESEGKESFERTLDTARQTAESAREKVGEAGRTAREKAGGVGETLEGQVTAVLHRMGVPSRTEIRDLTRRIEQLTAQVESLHATQAAPAGAAAPGAGGGSTVPAKQPPKLPADTATSARPKKTSGGTSSASTSKTSSKAPKPGGAS